MACYTEVRFKEPVEWKQIKSYLENDLIKPTFGNNYKTNNQKHSFRLKFVYDPWKAPHIEWFKRKNKKGLIKAIEWSDNSFCQMDAGWFANWSANMVAVKFGGMIYSESLDEVYAPEFHTLYPTLTAWIMERNRVNLTPKIGTIKLIVRSYLKELKKALPEEVYKVFARTK